MDLILLTGATGFIGGHVARKLLNHDYNLRLYVRDRRRCPPDLEGVDVIEGDLLDPAVCERAVKGVHTIIHGAALTRARTIREFYRVNRDGSIGLYHAASRVPSCRRFVFLSSQAAAGPARGDRPREESDPPEPLSHYGRSKLEAELELLSTPGPSVASLRLSAVYGPGDREIFPFFQAAERGWVPLPAPPSARLQLIHVEDAVDGVVLAAENDCEGVFFLAHPEVHSYRSLISLLGKVSGKEPVVFPLPAWVVHSAAAINAFLARSFHRTAIFNPGKARELRARQWTCSITKAQSMLKFSPRIQFESGARDTLTWYRQQHWLH